MSPKELKLQLNEMSSTTSTDALIEALLSEAHETAENIILDAKKTVQETLNEQRKCDLLD